MARNESDREDLLREATALVERIELSPQPATGSTAENVVIGFRAGGAVCIFFGTDPVYQFNAAGELRRAYSDGFLYKAARYRLVSLRRLRQPNEVQLLRHELTDAEQGDFIVRMQQWLRDLADNLDSGRCSVVGQVPPETNVLTRARRWLAAHSEPGIAATPHV